MHLKSEDWKGGDGDKLLRLKQDRSLEIVLETIFEVGRVASPGGPGDNLRDLFVLKKALTAQAAVCHLNIGPSTGFMISEDILLTCHHVLRDKKAARDCQATFDLQLDENGMPMTSRMYRLAPEGPNGFFETSKELDLTVVRVDGNPLAGADPIRVTTINPMVGNSAIVIQHPSHPIFFNYKKIALGDMEVKFVNSKVLQYLSDTLPGSSGAAIFNDDLNLIGIHQAGELQITGTHSSRNQGVHIAVIRRFLRANGLGHLISKVSSAKNVRLSLPPRHKGRRDLAKKRREESAC